MEITREIAIKVRDIVDVGLVRGKGVQVPGQMCVEAAVCAALGLPHSDDPPCVDSVLRTLKISLNDLEGWSSTKSRAAGMRRLALAQLGSAGAIDNVDFICRTVKMTVRRFLPIALRAAALVNPVLEHKRALEDIALQCEQVTSLKECEAAGRAADWAADAARWAAGEAADAARWAAGSAAYSADAAGRAAGEADAAGRAGEAGRAARWAARSADAAGEAAGRAARSADRAARWAARSAAKDKLYADFCEGVVQVLIEMRAPGCQWLNLVEVQP
jgi:hypothetical protein